MARKTETPDSLTIHQIETGVVHFAVLGRTPLILNRLSEKARRELLLPRGRRNVAERAASLKHDPITEFRASPYIDANEDGPTYLQHLASAFKGALRGAALDMPGVAKTQIGRLCWIPGDRVPIYGDPKLFMEIVRSADKNRTPDVRTRTIVPQWASEVTIEFSQPILTATAVGNLFAAAGIIQGVGDWRPEKGAGSYGQFELVERDDPRWLALLERGRSSQREAMAAPVAYNAETEELLAWYQTAVQARGALKAV